MKKKLYLIIVFVCAFCVNFMSVEAATSYTIKEKCTIRTEPNEGGTWLVPGQSGIWYLDSSDVVTIVDGVEPVASNNSKCSTKYYNVMYSGKKGYVCGDFINFTTGGKYYEQLKNQGFPESYLLSLNSILEKYPNWKLVPKFTELNWNDVVNKQSTVGVNFIGVNNPNGSDSVYLSLDGGSYNSVTKTYIRQEAENYYAANKYTVAYYLDPRNFLNERDIFVFENNINSNLYSDNEIQNGLLEIFKGSLLNNYTSIYLNAKTIGTNPIFLAARSRIEVSAENGGLSPAASGISGYYNFYNISAFSSCENPIYCGNNFAQGKGWTTPDLAITGGAYWIYKNYTLVNQNTLYTQKFNIINPATHQFMTNILAPRLESDLMYKGYSAAGVLSKEKTFYIPVYNNMPEVVSSLPTAINQDDLNNANAGNEVIKNTLSVPNIVNGAGYVYNSNYIYNIGYSKTANSIISSLKNISNDAEIKIEINGNVVSGEEIVSTGAKISITNNSNSEILNVVNKGDLYSDGKIRVNDLLDLQKYLLNAISLDDSKLKAADVDNDGKVNVNDLLKIQKHLLNKEIIG